MKGHSRIWIAALLALTLALGAGAAVFAMNGAQPYLDAMSKDYSVPDILPPGVQVQAEYAPGPGEPVGALDMVQNSVWIIHADAPGKAYPAMKERAVYQGDTIITGEQAACVVALNDQSSLSLGAITRLVIDRSVYDPAKNRRDSFFSMLWGKVRCVVRKIASTGEEDFKVNTPMATLGVRGSDFVVALVPPAELERLQQTSFLDRLELVQTAYAAMPDELATFVATGPDTELMARTTDGTSQVIGPNTFFSAYQKRMRATPFDPGVYNRLLQRINVAQLPVLRMPELLE